MELTCIVCPMGCRMTAEKSGGEIKVSGNTCKRGETYAVQEMTCPMRTLTSLVKVRGGEGPLCPVKTRTTIPKAMIEAALEQVRGACIDAPVKLGDVVIADIAGTGVDLIATANRAKEA